MGEVVKESPHPSEETPKHETLPFHCEKHRDFPRYRNKDGKTAHLPTYFLLLAEYFQCLSQRAACEYDRSDLYEITRTLGEMAGVRNGIGKQKNSVPAYHLPELPSSESTDPQNHPSHVTPSKG